MSEPLDSSALRVVGYGPAAAQHLLCIEPSERSRPMAGAILVHGGFWRAEKDAASLLPACRALADERLLAASAEYRTVEVGGVWPVCVEDIVTAVRVFGAHTGVPLSRTVLIGHSAGGHLALLAAARLPKLGGVVGLAPVTDLLAAHREQLGDNAVLGLLGGRAKAERLRAASPRAGLPPSCPVLLLHGDADQAVPVTQSTGYAEMLRGVGCPVRLVVVPEARHMHLVNPDRPAWPWVAGEIRSLVADVTGASRLAGRGTPA